MGIFIRLFFWTWFAGAVAAGYFLWLQRVTPLAIPALVLALASGVTLAYFRLRPLRAWVDALDLRALVLVHLVRFIGFHLLVLSQRGELARTFALPAGVGDIIVATMALPVAFAPLTEAQRRRAISIWNVFGFMHLLLVLGSMARINLESPLLLRSLTYLPLSLLPTFIVPLLLVAHVILFTRLRPAE